MGWWTLAVLAVVATLSAKGWTTFAIERLRNALSLSQREAMGIKARLGDLRQEHQRLSRERSAKEHDIKRLRSSIADLERRIKQHEEEEKQASDAHDKLRRSRS